MCFPIHVGVEDKAEIFHCFPRLYVAVSEGDGNVRERACVLLGADDN